MPDGVIAALAVAALITITSAITLGVLNVPAARGKHRGRREAAQRAGLMRPGRSPAGLRLLHDLRCRIPRRRLP